jgi:hypothetical protein
MSKKKISDIRLGLEAACRDLKSRLRGIAHGPTSYKDQRELLLLKPQLTACYILISESRGRVHLSEKTEEIVRNRTGTALDDLLERIRQGV